MAYKEQVTCPVCEGTLWAPMKEGHEYARTYKPTPSWYDPKTDKMKCMNCGGQTMSGTPTGRVLVDPETGKGCIHTYTSRTVGNCLTEYSCKKCGSRFQIDSGD